MYFCKKSGAAKKPDFPALTGVEDQTGGLKTVEAKLARWLVGLYCTYCTYLMYVIEYPYGTWTHDDEDSFLALTPFFVKRSSHSLMLNFEPSFTEFGIRSPVRDGNHDNGVSQMTGFFHSRGV